MGGGHYDGDVARHTRATTQGNTFSYEGYRSRRDRASGRRSAHTELDPKNKIRECINTTPIVVAMDVTRSRGNDSRAVYEKLPMFMGQLDLHNYVENPAVSFAAIGDANSDQAPLQVGQFEADNRLDDVLSKFWLEEGGGGTGQESYELAAYFYARQTRLSSYERGEKGFFFFVGDEGFYPTVEAKHIANILGIETTEDIDSAQIFAELQEKFHVFLIFPKKSWQERKSDIDAEIKKRVEAAGGLYEGVDIRASLLWNNRNDLDLHIIPPSGEEVYYGHPKSKCKGWLDVDMNVRGETLKPVENIRWAKGDAPKGRYKVIVQNYGFHGSEKATDFRVELEINGDIQHFEGTISRKGETGSRSNVLVAEFDYNPEMRTLPDSHQDTYANYDDAKIKSQWAKVIPPSHILSIEDPKSIIDVMLGTLAITTGHSDLNTFADSMQGRLQSSERSAQTIQALQSLAMTHQTSPAAVQGDLPTASAHQSPRQGHRL